MARGSTIWDKRARRSASAFFVFCLFDGVDFFFFGGVFLVLLMISCNLLISVMYDVRSFSQSSISVCFSISVFFVWMVSSSSSAVGFSSSKIVASLSTIKLSTSSISLSMLKRTFLIIMRV